MTYIRDNKIKRWMGVIAALVVFGFNASSEVRGDVTTESQASLLPAPTDDINAFLAAGECSEDEIKGFCARYKIDKSNIDSLNATGDAFLVSAAAYKRINVVTFLLGKVNADANIKRSHDGCTALHYAAYERLPEMCRLLLPKMNLEAINIRNNFEKTAYDWADQLKDEELKELKDGAINEEITEKKENIKKLIQDRISELINLKSNLNDLFGMIVEPGKREKRTKTELAKALNKVGDINATDKMGWTPLHVAAAVGDIKAVDAILEQDNVEINAQDKLGQTPLIIASIFDKKEVIGALIEKGADQSHTDLCCKRTAKEWAEIMGNLTSAGNQPPL